MTSPTPDPWRRPSADIERDLGPLDAVVSAAGHYAMTPAAEIEPADWQRMLRVHLGGALHLARAAAPGMVHRGSGSIVAITSELAIGGGAGDAHYAAAKGALIGLVRSLAAELAPHGVRVNAVAPGPTDTPMLAADSPWRDPEYLATLPSAGWSHPRRSHWWWPSSSRRAPSRPVRSCRPTRAR